MALDRTRLPSIVYWRGHRQPQRFYVALCLLVSSIQDWALGQKERVSGNLNWSATCSYYSLVHASRLLTFLALGDFPMSHAQLRRLLSFNEPAPTPPRRSPDGYPFDWLRGFSHTSTADLRTTHVATVPGSLVDLRMGIVQYLSQIGLDSAGERLERFGKVIAAAGPLRSDSNYEALLIAHEYRHVTMSSAFETLSRCMGDAAQSQLPFAGEAFCGFVKTDPDLAIERAAYGHFGRVYLDQRLIPAILRKLTGFPDVEAELQRLVARIQLPDTQADYRRLEDAVSMNIFGQKARLMNDFGRRIEDLCRAVPYVA